MKKHSTPKKIAELESIHNATVELQAEFEALLARWKKLSPKYEKLMNWYFSEKYQNDVEADAAGAYPEKVARGVLSEDAVYNLHGKMHYMGMDLIRVGLELLEIPK